MQNTSGKSVVETDSIKKSEVGTAVSCLSLSSNVCHDRPRNRKQEREYDRFERLQLLVKLEFLATTIRNEGSAAAVLTVSTYPIRALGGDPRGSGDQHEAALEAA